MNKYRIKTSINQVVNTVYMLTFKYLSLNLWRFFINLKCATNVPHKLWVFLQILVVLSKNKKPCKFKIRRVYKGLEHLMIKFLNLKVNAEGFEPSTACLEGRCSIQLSYASICFKTLWQSFGRGGRIRTCGLLLPKQAR